MRRTGRFIRASLCSAALLAACFGIRVLAQSNGLPPAWQQKTVVHAFSADRTLPKIENGYLVSFHRTPTRSGSDPTIVLRALSAGQELDLPSFSTNGGVPAWIDDVTVTTDQHVLVSGVIQAAAATTSESYFIDELDLLGNVVKTVDTGQYETEKLCAAGDGSVWAFGQDWTAEAKNTAYNMLRKYSADGQFSQSYFPRQNVKLALLNLSGRIRPGTSVLPLLPNVGRTFLQCAAGWVGVYVGPAKIWFQANPTDGSWQSYRAILPKPSPLITGFAALDASNVYASFRTVARDAVSRRIVPATLQHGLYRLNLSQGPPMATWEPVTGTINKPHSQSQGFRILVGREGSSLVIVQRQSISADGSAALLWTKPSFAATTAANER
jgi:hypothetical protein